MLTLPSQIISIGSRPNPWWSRVDCIPGGVKQSWLNPYKQEPELANMAKDKLIEIIQRILKTDTDIGFLSKLDQTEPETLAACIRDRITIGSEWGTAIDLLKNTMGARRNRE